MHIRIDAPDESLAEVLRSSVGRMDAGGLDRLGEIAVRLGLIQATMQADIRRPAIVLFAGDHGAIAAGASMRPQKITWQTVERIVAGRMPINVACRQLALTLSVVDAGVGHDFPSRVGLINAKIEHGTANYALEPAMWRSQLERAIETGRTLAHGYAAQGCNTLGVGSIGVGAYASAALLTHCLTPIALADLSATPGEGDTTGLARRHALLERALTRAGRISDPLESLREYGGFEIAMMTGFMLGAAEKHQLLIVDGPVAASALIVAHRIAPAVLAYTVLAGLGKEPGHACQARTLGLEPLLASPPGDGSGVCTALAMPMLRMAAGCLSCAAGLAPADHGHQQP